MVRLAIACFFIGCSGSPKGSPAPPKLPEPASPGDPVPPATPPGTARVDPDQVSGPAAKRDAELATKVSGYVDAFANSAPVFTRDGKRIIFLSTRDGLPQPYLATLDGPAARIATTAQRIRQVVAAPGGKDLVFASDTNADEHWSYFRIGLDGKNLVELTPSKLDRDRIFIPDGRPSQIYFTARSMADSRTTLYTTSAVAAGEAKPVFSDPLTSSLFAVSSDGNTALVRRFPTRGENHLLRVDLESGVAEPIFGMDHKASIFDAAITRDGKRALVATDNGEEQALLLALDLKTGKQLAKRAFTPATAQITGLDVAKEGGLVAVSITAGTRSEIQLVDSRSLAVRTAIAMPPGSGFANQFSDDGKQLLVTWSTPDRPTDVFVVDTRSGKVTGRNEPRPSLPALSIDATTVEIPAFDGLKLPTNVLVAKGEQTKKHPVVVWFHGGPSDVATLRWFTLHAALVGAGYVVVEPNIRGSTGFGRAFEAADNLAKRADSIKDVETVGRWVAQQPWADKDRVIAMGGSWGGYLTLIALTRFPELWRAGVDLFGVVNLRSLMATTSGRLRQIMLDELGDPAKDGALLDASSPITGVAKLVDPLFVYAGATDPRVPRAESDLIVRTLRSRKVPVEYMVADNEGHSVARRETQVQLFSRILRFLEQHLE